MRTWLSAVGFTLACCACSGAPAPSSSGGSSGGPTDDAPVLAPSLVPERGFLDLAQHATAVWSAKAGHLFYAFFPANENAEHKPLFVFFNGGPGFPTTVGLLTDGTAPTRVDENGAVFDNAASFTSMGNLLYVDPRQTGFSYDDAPYADETFGMVTDAADVASALIRFLDAHEALRDSKVVLVAESYGGLRAQLVTSLLRNGGYGIDAARSSQITIGAHVLIQPAVVGALPTHDTPASVCPYDTRRDLAWCDALGAAQLVALADPARSSRIFGGTLDEVPHLRAARRHGFRASSGTAILPESALAIANAAFELQWGKLAPGDAYFAEGPAFGDWATDNEIVPTAFLDNLRRIPMLITNAKYDDAIHTTDIVQELAHAGVHASLDTGPRDGVTRPGWMHVALPADPAAGMDAVNVEIRLPPYEAGHMVTLSEARAFHDDVDAFLRERGVLP